MVLVSGGVDSAACIDLYQRQGFAVRGLHVTYGQMAALHEVTAAKSVASHYGIPIKVVDLYGARLKSLSETPGRNPFLLFTALLELDTYSTILALGIHSGTPYYDCSPGFISAAQVILDGQFNGRVRISAPFLEWTKMDIWDYCLEHHVPVELTYSCESGLDRPCGVCRSCHDMEGVRAR